MTHQFFPATTDPETFLVDAMREEAQQHRGIVSMLARAIAHKTCASVSRQLAEDRDARDALQLRVLLALRTVAPGVFNPIFRRFLAALGWAGAPVATGDGREIRTRDLLDQAEQSWLVAKAQAIEAARNGHAPFDKREARARLRRHMAAIEALEADLC